MSEYKEVETNDEKTVKIENETIIDTQIDIVEVSKVIVNESILGFDVLKSLSYNAKILILCKSVRMYAYGFLSVMLVLFLISGGLGEKKIGLLFSLTLLGDAIISLYISSRADRIGRKKFLQVGCLLSVVTSFIFAFQTNFYVLLVTGILGVISPAGNEIGPFMAIELSSLSQVIESDKRTMLMAWYNLFGSFSSAAGALSCGLIIHYVKNIDGGNKYTLFDSYRISMYVYSSLKIVLFILIGLLTSEIEVPLKDVKDKVVNPVSLFLGLHKSKGIVLKLSCLFIIDAFGGSFIFQSFISGWFKNTYDTSPVLLGSMVFFCNIFAGISALFAAKLADSIGLIMTMVVTHLPSNVLVILIPLMPTEQLSIIMLCLRFCISQMDVPTRNAYVQGVVVDDERSAANGVTNVVRSVGSAFGPLLAGVLYANPKYKNYPFFIAGSLKIVYDLLLLWSFESVKTDHEIVKEKMKKEIDNNNEKNKEVELIEIGLNK